MKYAQVVQGTFIRRVNRFIAHVEAEGAERVVHVKNTGRCAELLLPGVQVMLEKADERAARKTAYSLIAVYKEDRLINIDSQAPNRVLFEALAEGAIPGIGSTPNLRAEVAFGRSRFDLYWETGKERAFMEVKGVTLEEDGIVRFPDAPTVRGTKHVLEMTEAVEAGYRGHLFFLVQMKDVLRLEPNRAMDPAFAEALRLAARRGVRIWAYDSEVAPDGIRLGSPVEVRL